MNHFSHEEHPLILKDLQVDDEGEEVVCYGCKQPIITESSTTYCCVECKFFLHKSCAEAPLEIEYPMHQDHPLQLLSKPPYKSGSCTCNVCGRSGWKGFTYNCMKCEFDVDILCAQMESNSIIKHPGHHHPLKFQPKSALFECDACYTEERDQSYDCTVCSFRIHKTCGSIPRTSSFKAHYHPLSLEKYFPEKYRQYQNNCDICKKKLHPNFWVLYCGPCRYVFHLKCITSKEDEATQTNSNCEIPSNTINLPVKNVSSLLIQHFLEQNGAPLIELSSDIKHFSHDHPLILSNIQDDYYEMDDDDQETMCIACVEPISGSCYRCVQCNHFVHVYCAQLPMEISHHNHPEHQLFLRYHEKIFFYSNCTMCDSSTNGFMYQCDECMFMVDIKCAFLPTTIKHEAHDHLLVRSESSMTLTCNACTFRKKDFFFSCKGCEYNLSRRCAILPKTAGHRWDKHPLILSIPPFYYHPDDIMCDFCEEEIHPKFWMYHCQECDNSSHLNCFPRFKRLPNMKFGSTIQIDTHPHPLTFSRKVKYQSHCSKCHKNVSVKRSGFECELCYLTICLACVREIHQDKSE